MDLFFALSIIIGIASLTIFIPSLGVDCENLLDSHLSFPIAIIPAIISIFLATVGIILLNPMVFLPITIVYFVIGYILSLKWFGKFINSRKPKTKKIIMKKEISKYFFPIVIIYFWPLIYVVTKLRSITFSIQTPGKIFDEIKKNG